MLRELIQNADDAVAPTLEIYFESDKVEESQPAGEVEESRPGETEESWPVAEVEEPRPVGDVEESQPVGEVEESRPAGEAEESRPVGEVRDINKLNVRNLFIGGSVQPSLLSRYASGSSRTRAVSNRRIGRGSEE